MKIRRCKRCRVQGCRIKTKYVYSFVVAPGWVVTVHLCPEHRRLDLIHGDGALQLKPVVPPETTRAMAGLE